MAVRTFLPPSERLASPDLGLIYFNHMGSCGTEDAGGDGHFQAHMLGLPVVVADRPGSGLMTYPSESTRKRLAKDYQGEVQKLTPDIEEECAAHGIRRWIINGRSMGGTAAIVFANQAKSNIVGVYTADMGACRKVEITSGRLRYAHDRALEKFILEKDTEYQPDIIRPEENGLSWPLRIKRALSIGYCYPVDFYNNEEVLAQRLAINAASNIFHRRPNIHMFLDFPWYSHAADNQQIRRWSQTMKRDNSNGVRGKVVVEQVPNTVHASFDNREFYVKRLKRLVDVVIRNGNNQHR